MLPFFDWLESLQFAANLDPYGYLVATINVVHLLSLALFVGAVIIVDMRLLGGGISKQPVAQLARDAQPWMIAGFLSLLVTGMLQVVATPMKAYYSPHFWLKMELVIVAVIFTFTVRRKVTLAGEARFGQVPLILVALISIALWTTIAVAGRLIGLMS